MAESFFDEFHRYSPGEYMDCEAEGGAFVDRLPGQIAEIRRCLDIIKANITAQHEDNAQATAER